MKQIKIIRLWILALTVVCVTSCTERIDVALDSETKRLVVDGHIGIDTTTYYVDLSTTSDYFNADMFANAISHAEVMITEVETGRTMLLTEDPVRQGRYMTASDAYGLQGYNYRLDIKNVDLNRDGNLSNYSAVDYMPNTVGEIDSIKAPFGKSLQLMMFGFNDTTLGWNVCLWAEEPTSHEYYAFIIYKNGKSLNDTLANYEIMNDAEDMMGGNVDFLGFPVDFLGYDDGKGKVTYSGRSAKYNFRQGDRVGFEIRSISKAFYTYNTDVRTIYGGSNPLFGSTPSNVRGNVSNGAIGFFAAYPHRYAENICDTAYTVDAYFKEKGM